MNLRSSILIASFNRPDALRKCLAAVLDQTRQADEIIVVWQGDDTATRDEVSGLAHVRAVHCAERGVVPAENAALAASTGDVVLLIDDDAHAPRDWVERHLRHYDEGSVGAVGGPAVNHRSDGTPFPIRSAEPVGTLSWLGRTRGNMHDQPPGWRSRAPIEVDHLVGYNMSLRRSAFDRFDAHLRPYWQMFELDACLQARRRGFRVLFDFANVVDHHPTNPTYTSGRDGDLQIKIYNAAYNHAYILAKHRTSTLQGLAQRAFAYAIGTTNMPGMLAALVGAGRFGKPLRELAIMTDTWKSRRAGERDGRRVREHR